MDEMETSVAQTTETNNYSSEQTNVGTVESSTTSENTETGTNTSANTENAPEGQQTPSEGNRYILATDEYGNRVLKAYNGENSPENAGETAETEANSNEGQQTEGETAQPQEGLTNLADNVQQQINAPKTPYSIAELSVAIAANNVDETRVPPEYMQQYASYKINQAIAAENMRAQQIRQQQAAEQARLQQQLNPENQQKLRQEFYANLNQEAERRAMEDAGLTEDEVNNLDFLADDDEKAINYRLAKEWHRQELMNQLQVRSNAENAVRAQRDAIYRGIDNYVAEQRSKEANFDIINNMMLTQYKEQGFTTFDKAKEIENAIMAMRSGLITEAQTMVLREYYEATRKAFYAKRNHLSTTPKKVTTPPKVERSGGGREMSKSSAPDYGALRNAASPDDKIAWMKQYLFGNRS